MGQVIPPSKVSDSPIEHRVDGEGGDVREGTIVYNLGRPRGIHNANVTSGTNNDIFGAKFSEVGDGSWRFNIPAPPGYTRDDVVLRVYWSAANSGAVGEQVRLSVGHQWPKVGTTLGSYTEVAATVEMEAYSFDDHLHQDFTIPEADVDTDAAYVAIRMQRLIGVVAVDFGHVFYVHSLAWVYTGEGY